VPADSDTRPDRDLRNRLVTVYGRKPVLETLRDPALQCHTLHLARSNREGGIVADIRAQAAARDLPVRVHTRQELARISRNGRQDQGVALDVLCPSFAALDTYLAQDSTAPRRLLAVDGITNPQNLGMIVRSAAAGAIDGIVLPRRGNAALGPLVIKASAGTLFRAPVLTCADLSQALALCRAQGAEICTLDAGASQSLFDHRESALSVYVLGNETSGVSPGVRALCDRALSIPMRNGVESLNVAVAASLIAFLPMR